MAENVITIKIEDNSNGNSFSNNDIGESIQKAATTTKTDITLRQKASSNQIAKTVGMNVANTATNGLSGQMLGIAASFTTPVGIAMMALGVANQLYAEWKEMKRQQQEQVNTLLSAGGKHRTRANLYNVRTNMITGKTYGGTQTIYGRR
ncbi:hypothetical protein KHQ81_12840 [Mycoplasmatota bacterium]|nr:hypothetical protein KHQ81_12840 [Mycoplasmatota bacterium]